MNEVPLIQNVRKNDINTSIIAIKKQLKQLIEAVGLIESPNAPDLSPYVKKADVTDVVEVGNLNPVTSNGVAIAISGNGNLLGTILAIYSNRVPAGYLPCNGVAFDENQYPALYQLLGDNHTPDLRECTLKMIGESGRAVGAHVKSGGLALGEFIDDRLQEHNHGYTHGIKAALYSHNNGIDKYNFDTLDEYTNTGRTGATTEVKAVGVNYVIKATSGLDETQQDYVLRALNEAGSYSTEEVATGKKWIDGKPIYRKVLICTSSVTLSLNNWTDVTNYFNGASSLANVVNDIIDAKYINNDITTAVVYDTMWTFVNKTNHTLSVAPIGLSTGTTTINSTMLVVEYTKTTDA